MLCLTLPIAKSTLTETERDRVEGTAPSQHIRTQSPTSLHNRRIICKQRPLSVRVEILSSLKLALNSVIIGLFGMHRGYRTSTEARRAKWSNSLAGITEQVVDSTQHHVFDHRRPNRVSRLVSEEKSFHTCWRNFILTSPTSHLLKLTLVFMIYPSAKRYNSASPTHHASLPSW